MVRALRGVCFFDLINFSDTGAGISNPIRLRPYPDRHALLSSSRSAIELISPGDPWVAMTLLPNLPHPRVWVDDRPVAKIDTSGPIGALAERSRSLSLLSQFVAYASHAPARLSVRMV
jgi:hypothetical protein